MATDSGGYVLVTGDGAGHLRVWDFRSGRLMAERDDEGGPIWSIALATHRRQIAFAGACCVIRLWDPSTNESRELTYAGSRRTLSMQFRSEEHKLAWAGVNGKVFEESTGSEAIGKPLHVFGAEALAVELDQSGRWIAFSGHRRNLELIDCGNPSLPRRLEGHRGNVSSIAFHPDGSLLASGSADGTVRIWRTDEAQQLFVLRGHREPVLSVRFSQDGKMLASGDAAGGIILWCVDDRKNLAQFAIAPASSAGCLAFGIDSHVLAVAGTGPEVHLWDLTELRNIGTL